MAEQYRFFGSAVGDTREYSQVEFAEVLGTIVGNGYLGQVGNELEVFESTPNAMTVKVDTGQAWINGYWYKNDAVITVPIDTADATYDRRDLVVLKLDVLIGRLIEVTVVKGTPAPAPVQPALTQTSQIWEIPLAEVRVNAGVVSISSSDITDARYQALLQDTDEILAEVALKAPLASPTFTGTPTISGSGRVISNSASTGTDIYFVWSGTQAQYDAISSKDANTLYFIV